MAHTKVAIFLLIASITTLVLVASGILAFFPNPMITQTCSTNLCLGPQINPMNYLIPGALFLLTPIVWYAMGRAEGEIQG